MSVQSVPDLWSPRWDADFEPTWLTYLVTRPFEWCHASDLYATDDPWQRTVLRERSHEVVLAARRLGLVVESDPARGYRVTGFGKLPRYVHLVHKEGDEVAAGQMVLT